MAVEQIIGILILLALVVLGVCTVMSWVRYNQEGRGPKYLIGALASSVFTVIGFWFVFFSGVLS